MKKVSFTKGAFGVIIFFIFAATLFLLVREKIPIGDFFRRKRIDIGAVIRYFPFSKENSLREWEEKILKGQVVYVIEKGNALSYVRAKSEKAASALYYKIKLNVKKRPRISWRWRVDKFPERTLPERIENKKEEDFAARVYVIFPAAFFTRSKCIEYIWAQTLPVGTCGQSGYSKNIKVMVLAKGGADAWHSEERDIVADYVKLFGKEPRLNVGAIAFMTDADSTGTYADAVYDEIKIGYR
ncbi:MAG: DUF3047 domain-containing protein [Candidatus Omnitrophota bacterium]